MFQALAGHQSATAAGCPTTPTTAALTPRLGVGYSGYVPSEERSTAAPGQAQSSENAQGERFDEALEKLQAIAEKLEGGKLSLEESLAAFEEGVRLAKTGQATLDAAEKRVEVLTRGAQGDLQAQPFDPGEE